MDMGMGMGMRFYHEQGSGLNQPSLCFESSAIEDKSEMIMMGGLQLHGMDSSKSLSFSGISGVVNGSSASVVVDSVPELKHRAGLAVEWTVEEQHKLEEALPKYDDEPGIIRYVKIAATLRNKTVRDVALRCRWLGKKRRKNDELNLWKKIKDKKDKSMESSSKPCVPSYTTVNVAPFSVSVNHQSRDDALRGSIRHLLEQNRQVLGQISTNMNALRLQDNVDLFRQTKNNITAILDNMRCMPGPPLPISINEDLVNNIISIKSQTMMFPSSNRMSMKQEPGCW